MSDDCGVCLTGYEDGSSDDFCRQEIRTARKPHVCCECGRPIAVGEKYERASGRCDGGMWSEKTCLVCAEIAETFYCGPGGRIFGGVLWEQMDEVLENMTLGCVAKLKTARAKQELVRRWNERKFA
jgi:hypothetical protein